MAEIIVNWMSMEVTPENFYSVSFIVLLFWVSILTVAYLIFKLFEYIRSWKHEI